MIAAAALDAVIARIDQAEEDWLEARALLEGPVTPAVELRAEERRLRKVLLVLKDEADMCREVGCRTVGRCLEHLTYSMLRPADHAQLWDPVGGRWLPEVLVLDWPRSCPTCPALIVVVQPEKGPARHMHRARFVRARLVAPAGGAR